MLSQESYRGRKASVLLVAMLASCIAMVSAASAQTQRQGYLGVTTQTLTEELREGLDFSYEGEGALINSVSEGSPADRAGLRTGDIITSINGESISSSGELRRVVRGFQESETVSIRFIRNGSPRSSSVRLAGIDQEGVSGSDDFDWRSNDDFPVPPAPPAAPRAPRAPRAPSEPREPRESRTWIFEDDGNGELKESLKGLERLKDLEGLGDIKVFDGRNGDVLMSRPNGRGRLGVTIEDLDDDMAEVLDIPSGRGALVRSVVDDSPARRAGIKAGDVITRVNDRSIANSSDLSSTVRGLSEGPARVTVVRRSGPQTLTVDIERREPNVTRFRSPAFNRERSLMGERTRERADRMRLRADRQRDNEDLQREVEDLKREVERLRRELDRRDDR